MKPYILYSAVKPNVNAIEATADRAWDLAVGQIRREYRADLRYYADEVLERVEGGDDEGDAIHDTADGSSWVIYYSEAQKVLIVSDNDTAWAEEVGSDGLNWSQPYGAVCQRAYFAVCADLREAVEELREERAAATEEE